MAKKTKRKVKRKISYQKIFSFISFIFILTCCLWYGGRFIYFYLDSKKVASSDNTTFANTLKLENHDNKSFRKDEDIYYFYQDASNNYLVYSNIVWRIVKINSDDSITLISEEPITKLAYGMDDISYSKSPILQWLNNESGVSYSGVLEKKLNDVSHYLVKNSVCIDDVDNVEKISCDKTNNDYYLGLLSVEDYVKTGGKKSFIHGKFSSYLANGNSEKQLWYIDENGNLDQSLGDDILGIRPTITLSSTLSIKSGSGSKDDPYIIEEENGYFGSYVQLDKDIWRVYDFDDNNVKLVLTDYLKDTSGNYESIYSNSTYRHNDTIYGSLAYYLNHTYLNSLSYKNYILNANYYNGFYGEENDYGLKELFDGEIDTKVAVPSIGDVMFQHDLDGYFTSTGIYKNSTSLYVQKTGDIATKKVTSEAYVVPCITIKKEILKNGNGLKSNPYTT